MAYNTNADAPMVVERSEMFAISPDEAVHRTKEQLRQEASVNRIADQDLLAKKDLAVGMMLDHNELIRRIQLLNPKILIMPGGVRGAVAVRYPKYEFGEWHNEYITGFYLEPLPEYSSVTEDEKGLPVRESRGWRSVLLSLIACGALTKKQVDTMFGPARGQRTGLWYRKLQGQS